MPDWTSGHEDARQADYRDEGIHALPRGPKRAQRGPSLPVPPCEHAGAQWESLGVGGTRSTTDHYWCRECGASWPVRVEPDAT